ncbi:uncharacterized protein [Eurosta solidaginis]|uniref:uncharacterized protein n=1 Tax=Eurosta solidaginis TaxID=178769 RepID=UPI0035309A9B
MVDEKAIITLMENLQTSNQAFIKSVIEANTKMMQDLIAERHSSGERQNTAIPNFYKFNKTQDRWSTYLLQLEQHFEAHGVNDDNAKRACILSWIGAENVELLQKLFDGKVKEKTFKEITSALTQHFVEKVHVLSARVKFYRTLMKSEQSYSDWVAELKGAAKDCLFKCAKQGCEESYADSKIRDMIVIHTPHEKVQTAALQKVNPTLEEILNIATVYEATVRTCNEIQGAETATVNVVQKTKSGQLSRTSTRKESEQMLQSCPECSNSHKRENCYHYKNKTKCNRCSKIGHLALVCKSAMGAKKPVRNNNTNAIESGEDENMEEICTLDTVHTLGMTKRK